mgnify:CR=1 FL=1
MRRVLPALLAAALLLSTEGIARPKIGFPAFSPPGGEIEAVVRGIGGEFEVSIEGEFSSAPLEVVSEEREGEALRLRLRIPEQVEPGLYDLVVRSGGSEFREPNSVAVVESKERLSVLWVSDTHYDIRRSQERQAARFQRTVWLANFLSPDLVILTGDACNNPHEVIFEGLRRELQDLDVPIIVLPGNHDHAPGDELFSKYIGVANESLDVLFLHVSLLDTGPGSLNGALTPEQLSWLREDLESSDAPVKIVLMHHPPFAIENRTGAGKAELLEAASGADAILSGHMHENYVYEEPVLMVTNPNCYGEPAGTAIPGFRFFWVDPTGIEWLGGVSEPIRLDYWSVEYLQLNDGSSPGFSALIENGGPWPLNGTLRVRLSGSGEISVEGGELLWVRESRLGYRVAAISVSVGPGESVTVSAWTEPDTDPPEASLEWEVEVKRSAVIYLNWTVRDDVLGVAEAECQVSAGGESKEVRLLRLDEDTFIGTVTVPAELGSARIRLRAVDVSGKESTFKEEVSWAETPGAPPWLLPAVIGAAALAAAVLLARRLRS